jgi:hypothetical protein
MTITIAMMYSIMFIICLLSVLVAIVDFSVYIILQLQYITLRHVTLRHVILGYVILKYIIL